MNLVHRESIFVKPALEWLRHKIGVRERVKFAIPVEACCPDAKGYLVHGEGEQFTVYGFGPTEEAARRMAERNLSTVNK
jgi:hypothetical protein